jgi:hypothetical protein
MAEICSQILMVFLLMSIFSFNFGSAQLSCWKCDPCPDPFDNTSSLVSAVTCTSSQTACVVRLIPKNIFLNHFIFAAEK